MVELKGLKKTYRMGTVEVTALRGVTLRIRPGEFVAVMGPSGSGKSTLMHILGLLDVPDSGSYRLLGKEVSGLRDEELALLRRRAVGFVFQQFNLLPRSTALENAALPLVYSANGIDPARPMSLLKEVGLAERLGHRPNELSGGQQQRVAITRALVNQPLMILADEPTGNLDSASAEEIMKIFKVFNAQGLTVIVVTHEPEIARHAGRVIRMKDGHIQSDEVSGPAPAAAPYPAEPPPHLEPAPRGYTLREFTDHLREAFRAIASNKIRFGLSMLGILIGVAAVIAMLALGKGAQQAIEARIASLGSNLLAVRPGARSVGGVATGVVTARFTREDAREIAASIPGVRRVSAGVDERGQVAYASRNWNTEIMGTTAEYAPMRNAVPTVGRFFTEAEDLHRARVAVVGWTVVQELFDGKNPIGEFLKINRVNFRVIGVLPERGATGWRDHDDVVIIPLATAMRRVFGEHYVEDVDVEVTSAEQMGAVEKGIRELIVRRHRLPPSQYDSIRIRNLAEIQEALSETTRTMSGLLAAIGAISLLVGGIGIMNIMLVSVTERTREIGIRKAVGARRRDILAQFLIEAVVVTVAGGGLGIALGAAFAWGMSAWAGWAAAVSPAAVGLAFFFSAAVGIGFGLWPARKAALLHPIDALRYE